MLVLYINGNTSKWNFSKFLYATAEPIFSFNASSNNKQIIQIDEKY